MKIIAFYTLDGLPKTGLTVGYSIYNLSTSTAAATGNMTEEGGGFYYVDVEVGPPGSTFGVKLDGSATITNNMERYQHCVFKTDNGEDVVVS